VRPSSKRGTGGPSSGDSVLTEVGSSSTDSCIRIPPASPDRSRCGRFRWRADTRGAPPSNARRQRVPTQRAGYDEDEIATKSGTGEGCRMPQQAWSEKRERQYEHIKEGLREQGRSEDTAEEIAARTVNKERARSGEARTASRTSVEDISSGRRGGLRSHRGPGGRTYRQLYEEAKDRGVDGRSKMSKAQLERALSRRS
jgi:hypothetical protein